MPAVALDVKVVRDSDSYEVESLPKAGRVAPSEGVTIEMTATDVQAIKKLRDLAKDKATTFVVVPKNVLQDVAVKNYQIGFRFLI